MNIDQVGIVRSTGSGRFLLGRASLSPELYYFLVLSLFTDVFSVVAATSFYPPTITKELIITILDASQSARLIPSMSMGYILLQTTCLTCLLACASNPRSVAAFNNFFDNQLLVVSPALDWRPFS